MNTQISTKFAALVIALMVNGLILGGVAFLFESHGPQASNQSALAGKSSIGAHHVV